MVIHKNRTVIFFQACFLLPHEIEAGKCARTLFNPPGTVFTSAVFKEVESYDLSKFEFAIMDNNAYTY